MDRIDLQIAVPKLTPEELLSLDTKSMSSEPSASIRKRVINARNIQIERWKEYGYTCNAEIPEKLVKRCLTLDDETRSFLAKAAARFNLSGRGMSRVLKVSRTIADLAGDEDLQRKHVSEALNYRQQSGR